MLDGVCRFRARGFCIPRRSLRLRVHQLDDTGLEKADEDANGLILVERAGLHNVAGGTRGLELFQHRRLVRRKGCRLPGDELLGGAAQQLVVS